MECVISSKGEHLALFLEQEDRVLGRGMKHFPSLEFVPLQVPTLRWTKVTRLAACSSFCKELSITLQINVRRSWLGSHDPAGKNQCFSPLGATSGDSAAHPGKHILEEEAISRRCGLLSKTARSLGGGSSHFLLVHFPSF